MKGLERFVGGAVVGAGTEGVANAVAIELLAHWGEGVADDEADVPRAEVFDGVSKGRCRGVVDVADGSGVENDPPRRGLRITVQDRPRRSSCLLSELLYTPNRRWRTWMYETTNVTAQIGSSAGLMRLSLSESGRELDRY